MSTSKTKFSIFFSHHDITSLKRGEQMANKKAESPRKKPGPKKGQGGRPEEWTKEKVDAISIEFEEWLKDDNNIWFKSFCLRKGYNPDVMMIWVSKSDNFKRVYEFANHRQEELLLTGGLYKEFDAGLVKLVLHNKHKWESDKQAIDPNANKVVVEVRHLKDA